MTDSQRWFFLGLAVFAGVLIYLLQPILMPFLIGALFAYLGDPVVDRLEAAGLQRLPSVCLVFLIMTLGVVGLVLVLIPLLGKQLELLVSMVPAASDWFRLEVVPWLQHHLGVPADYLALESVKVHLLENWQSTGGVMKQLLAKATYSGMVFAGWLANLVLIPVVTFYLLRDWDGLMAKIQNLLPRVSELTIVRLARQCDEVLGAFFRGQLLIMVLLGAIYGFGLWLVGLKLALLLGMIAGLASIVPYLGFFVGIVAASIAALVEFNEWMPLVYVVIVFVVGQMLEGMLLTPLLVGDRIGLHPVAVIFAILAGGQLWGFVGVLLALPLAAVIMVLLRHAYDNYLNSLLYKEGQDKAQHETQHATQQEAQHATQPPQDAT